jgi:hypothetical protein
MIPVYLTTAIDTKQKPSRYTKMGACYFDMFGIPQPLLGIHKNTHIF